MSSDATASSAPSPIARAVHRAVEILPGLALAALTTWIAQLLARWLGALVLQAQGLDPAQAGSPVSAISVAVVLGLIVANTVGLGVRFEAGLRWTVRWVLRLGIILVGLKLSVIDVLQVGAVGIPMVAAIVAAALASTLWIARRAGLSRQLGSLAAASTAICGITATLAIAPSIEADDREVAYTVANVTLFGLAAMLVYPYLAHLLFDGSAAAAGLFLGTAIHDTSQVMGAAMAYREVFGDERALEVATVAKLTRNALLVAVVPTLALLHARATGNETAAGSRRPSLAKLFPMFVLGFLALSAVRSIGDVGLARGGEALGLLPAASWERWTGLLGGTISSFLLGMALASVGLTTRLSVLRGLGPRPFLVGLFAALWVGAVAAVLAAWVGPMLAG